jgi:anti-anti-sigma factor
MPDSLDKRSWILRIGVEQRNGRVVLTLAGRISHRTTPAVIEALARSGSETPAVLDLTAVDYLSSAGFEALETAAASRQLIVCNLSEPVRMAWRLAADSTRIQVEPSLEHALARLEGRAADEAASGR